MRAILGVLALLLGLAACGFQPVYGPGGTGRALQGQVAIDAPDDRDSFLLVQRLEERLGRAAAARYGLGLTLSTRAEGQAVTSAGDITRYHLVGRAGYALTDLATGTVVASGEVDNFTGYSATGSTVVTLAAERDARARLMTILADQITARLLALPDIGT